MLIFFVLMAFLLPVAAMGEVIDTSAGIERELQYYPDGRDIVCVNGVNRYSRALYGTHTLFRLETSDRPIFATYDKNKSRNIRFWFTVEGGKELQLDSVSFCEARYQGGKREYLLRDDSWPTGAEIRLIALASQKEEGALFRFEVKGMKGSIECKVCAIAQYKMSRGGDLGTDPRENFEPSATEDLLVVSGSKVDDVVTMVYTNPSEDKGNPGLQWVCDDARYNEEEAMRQTLVSQVEINTPNPFLNTLGANMMAAADGLWDGQTWLHGCIGWRMPLAGWRAAYVADVVGWNDRAKTHFRAYAKSQVTDVPNTIPHPAMDSTLNLARAEKRWGTPMYSNGYICRSPGKNDNMHHYDMNLNYVDELLWHFQYDADTAMMREFWPLLTLHLEWEKRNYDPDGDHLYDAYCCIWASDALYYNSGAVTHSSAYNYRGNLLAARIAELIGEDPTPYRDEADAILKAMNERLWLKETGCWAEYQDFMGLKRIHPSAALWSVYTPIDCEACTPEQAYLATLYVDRNIPHIPVKVSRIANHSSLNDSPSRIAYLSSLIDSDLFTLSTTDWLPYQWSTNNVAHEEVANMALAYLKAGRYDSGYKLLFADILDEMYLGQSPGNFGQISYYDKARAEAYRDFGDNVGITSRAIVNGLFGIIPDALHGKCYIRPAFPKEWQEASIRTPYLSYRYHVVDGKPVFDVEQNFPQHLEIVIDTARFSNMEHLHDLQLTTWRDGKDSPEYMRAMGLDDVTPDAAERHTYVDISAQYNSNIDDIFRNKYLSPRSPYTTLQIPVQGVGEWCIPKETYEIEDDGIRKCIGEDGLFDTGVGVKFRMPAAGHNIAYTSLWDNYPNELHIPVGSVSKGKQRGFNFAYLLMAGTTNNMQSRIDNGLVIANYADGSSDTLHLMNPINWCPIEQDFFYDNNAFWSSPLHPYRVLLSNGKTERSAAGRIIPLGAAQMLKMPLNPHKHLLSLTLRTLSNDVVIGISAITLER